LQNRAPAWQSAARAFAHTVLFPSLPVGAVAEQQLETKEVPGNGLVFILYLSLPSNFSN
jgi:hypothetical protein